jgi:chromosome segregation ATPase
VEQKWEIEKNLIGLKMDLDRADAEIGSLRQLLKDKDIFVPESLARSTRSSAGLVLPAASGALGTSYAELQKTYADALQRIKSLENVETADERTKLAIERLEHSLSTAIGERDSAKKEASSLRVQSESYRSSEKAHLASERDLATQLQSSARRVEELAQQVQRQLTANESLRKRLSDAVSRGEADQRSHKERISSMQTRLQTLEDQVSSAQTSSEERVTRHEAEVTSLKEAHSTSLQRLREELRPPPTPPPKSPMWPRFLAGGSEASRPTTPASGSEPSPQVEVEKLKAKVTELEKALATAEKEMQEVVGRMSAAQIEVMMLQQERDEASRETRRLQRVIDEQKVRVFEDKFKTITSPGINSPMALKSPTLSSFSASRA